MLRPFILALLSTLFVSACGGSSSDSSSDDTDTAKASISGRLSVALATAVDSDINDILAPFSSNNDPVQPQKLPNLVTLQGFLSAQGTGGSAATQRFANTPDPYDYYALELQQDQVIVLSVAGQTPDAEQQKPVATLNLALLATQDGQIDDSRGPLLASTNTSAGVVLVVPYSGQFVLRLAAASGVSRYILQLQDVQAGRSNMNASAMADFIAGEAIWRGKPEELSQASASANKNAGISTALTPQPSPNNTAQLLRFNTQLAAANVTASNDLLAQQAPQLFAKLTTLEQIAALRQEPNTLYVEPNYIRTTQQITNDSDFNSQWNLPQISAPQAWDITTGARADGGDVIIAVLDSGIRLNHPDLNSKLVSGYDFVSDTSISGDGDGIDDDPSEPSNRNGLGSANFHGTHVTGIAAAATNNHRDIAGVGWQTKVMPLRVLGKDGKGSSFDFIQALRFAAGLSNNSGQQPSQKADVINMSLGSSGRSAAEQDVINQIRNAGIILVAASGNRNTSTPFYPASYDYVVSVGATDFNRQRAPYSNYGSTLDLVAPGGDLTQVLNGKNLGILSLGASGTTLKQGTSMAAPHVSGVFALMKAVHPGLTPTILDNLINNQLISDHIGRRDLFGMGLINAQKAVLQAQKLANGGALPPLPTQLKATPDSLLAGEQSRIRFKVENIGGQTPVVRLSDNADWLTLTADEDVNNGLGNYTAHIDRSGLVLGYYNAIIKAEADNGAVLNINVFMQVGNFSATGDMTQQYVLLVKNGENKAARTVAATAAGDFTISNIEPGDYRLIAGSDIDANDKLCETAETCGAFPFFGQEPLAVSNNNVEDINITVAINIQGNSVSSQEAERFFISHKKQPIFFENYRKNNQSGHELAVNKAR